MPFVLLALGSVGVTCKHWVWSRASIETVGVTSGVGMSASVAITMEVGDWLTVGDDGIDTGVDGLVGTGVMIVVGNAVGTIVGVGSLPLQPNINIAMIQAKIPSSFFTITRPIMVPGKH